MVVASSDHLLGLASQPLTIIQLLYYSLRGQHYCCAVFAHHHRSLCSRYWMLCLLTASIIARDQFQSTHRGRIGLRPITTALLSLHPEQIPLDSRVIAERGIAKKTVGE